MSLGLSACALSGLEAATPTYAVPTAQTLAPQWGTPTPAVALTPAATPESAAAPSSLPAAELPSTYTVVPGDTLLRIARRFGITVDDLLAVNQIADPDRIYPGLVLILPNLALPQIAPVAESAPATQPAPALDPLGLPSVSARAREIYQTGLSLGHNPRAFAKVGDCNAMLPNFLADFDDPASYRLGPSYAYLQATISHFSGSFARDSIAARIGFLTANVLEPEWADKRVCQPEESPLQCEYRLQRPSLALVSLGTNDYNRGIEFFERNMRAIIEQSVALGVLPILGTKADNVEGADAFNAVLRRLAGEYDLPLWDFGLIAQRLPGGGLYSDGFHLTSGPNFFDSPETITGGWPWRNLTALQALDIVWQGVQ